MKKHLGTILGIISVLLATVTILIAYIQLRQDVVNSRESSMLMFRIIQIQEEIATTTDSDEITRLRDEKAILEGRLSDITHGESATDAGGLALAAPIIQSTATHTPLPTETPTITNTPPPTGTPTPKPPPTLTHTPTPDSRLFWDNFNEGRSDAWRIDYGEWRMVDGKIQAFDLIDRRAMMSIGDDTWSDYSVELDVGPLAPDHFSRYHNRIYVYVRTQNDDSSMAFGVAGNDARCWVIDRGASTKLKEVEVANIDPQPLRIEVKGSMYRFFVGAKQICYFEDSSYSSGGVSVMIHAGDYGSPLIDDFVVRSLQ